MSVGVGTPAKTLGKRSVVSGIGKGCETYPARVLSATMSRRTALSRWIHVAVDRPLGILLGAFGAQLLGSCVPPGEEQTNEKLQPAPVEQKSTAGSCPVAAAVNQDITLYKRCSPYLQPGGGIDVVNGATLTIEAGVELRFVDKDWLEVGAGGEPGRLIAKGTPEEPIVFTTVSPETEPTWLGVWFHSGTLANSVLSHAVVRQAGGSNTHSRPNLLQGCITLTGVKPGVLSIGQVQVEKCVNGGFRMTDSHVKLSGVSFVDTEQGFVLDAASAGQVTDQAEYRGVLHNLIHGGIVAADARWIPQAVPYVVNGDINVQGAGSPTLSLAPGLELRFGKSVALRVGVDQPGGIRAEGTREALVKLTANTQQEPWQGLQLMAQTSPDSRLKFVEIGETKGTAAVALNSEPGRVSISDSTFSRNETDLLVGCGAKPTLAGNRYASPRGLVQQASCK